MMHSFSERRMMIIRSSFLIFSFFNLMFAFASSAMHLCRPDQRDALWEFKSEFSIQVFLSNEMAGNTTTERWRKNTDCCSWDGVSCDPKTGEVVQLDLRGSNLNGPLRYNSSLFRLQHLQSLDFFSNYLWGVLPDSIGNLKHLRVLNLGFCDFFGKIPSSLGNLSYLTHLSFVSNDFSGELPDSIGNLKRLTELQLGGNKLSGNFPPMLLNLSEVTQIDLGSNQFEGMLPSNMSCLSKLKSFDISVNSFSGSIPSSLFMIPSLILLNLEKNGFSGPLEIVNISSPSKIEKLRLGENNFRLVGLDISANQIEGQVPEWLWRLPLLQIVNISQNSLSGFKGPADVIQKCENLYMLDISSNNFEGPFPLLPNSTSSIFGSNNRFSGEIPKTICELDRLDVLDLHNNYFSGSIPQCFNTSVSILNLRNNSLSGVLPEEFIGGDLISLDVGHNQLSGKLPKSLINCNGLLFLNVEENRFNDTFPFSLRLLPHLLLLVLRSNKLHGPLYSPGDSLSFPKLRIFDISDNSFTGVLPSDYFAGWSAMSLVNVVSVLDEGFIDSVAVTNKGLKMELVGIIFAMYKSIDVSKNKFEGDIPESIGLLKELKMLNMSNNAFTGRIPLSIVNLTNLESLDLSHNRLSGEIPPELGKLTFLARMNFSCNRLEGPIPQGTQIQNQNSSSLAENSGLCGAPLHETRGEEEATKQEKDEEKDDEEKDQVLSWVAASITIGYVPGVLCGITIGHILRSHSHFIQA